MDIDTLDSMTCVIMKVDELHDDCHGKERTISDVESHSLSVGLIAAILFSHCSLQPRAVTA